VFCCFNNAYKITPDIFDSWVRILSNVEDSVLWLSVRDSAAAANLRREATLRNLDADRLIFARRIPLQADHLARIRAADLFLDTNPYNAHTTACDALWVGVPVVTRIGSSFPGRVAASVLQAVDLPELITSTTAQYEQLCIALARDPQRLSNLRLRLAEKRNTAPLFKTGVFTQHLESGYEEVYARYRDGLPPDSVHVPSVT
jgi:predicted O-linked N-acetylglucosamine transferase (SPINDLY family)